METLNLVFSIQYLYTVYTVCIDIYTQYLYRIDIISWGPDSVSAYPCLVRFNYLVVLGII